MNVPETFFTISEELRLFFLSCIAGGIFGIYYDIFRTLRIVIPHHSFFVFLEDAVFLGTYAVFLSAFASAEARGELRAYYAFGGILGFILYYFTVGKFIVRLMERIVQLLKSLFNIIVKPAKFLMVKFVGINKNSVKSNKNALHLLQKNSKI